MPPPKKRRYLLLPPERWIAAAWLRRQQVVGGPKVASFQRLGPAGHRLALAGLADWAFGWLTAMAGLAITAESEPDGALANIGLIMILAGLPVIVVASVRFIQCRAAARAFRRQSVDAMIDIV
jgi:hypothetical protein